MLKTDDLIHGLRKGIAFTPYSISPALINGCIKRIRNKRMVLSQDDAIIHDLGELIGNSLQAIIPERQQTLLDCEVYVLPFPVCTAYSQLIGDRKLIVIGQGLIDLIFNTTLSAHIIANLPEQCDDVFPVSDLANYSIIDLLNTFSFTLLFKNYHLGEPLPNFAALASPEMIKDAKIAQSGAVLFVLLHELGHLQLGHHTNTQTRPMNFRKIVDEEMNLEQQLEFEADQYALNSIDESVREIGQFWLKAAFDFFVRLEVMAGQYTPDHPLTINRIADANNQELKNINYHDPTQSEQHIQKMATRFVDTNVNIPFSENHILMTSREACTNLILATAPTLSQYGYDVGNLFQDKEK